MMPSADRGDVLEGQAEPRRARRLRRGSAQAAGAHGRGRRRARRPDQLRQSRSDGVHRRGESVDGPATRRPIRRGCIAFGSVNPRFSKDVAGDTARVIDARRAGAEGPSAAPAVPRQRLPGHAARRSPISTASPQHAGVPVTIHTGTSVFPGARSRFGDPMDVDDVAIDFPKLTILLAHGGRPLWMEAAFFLVRRHPNVHPRGVRHPAGEAARVFPAPRGDRRQDDLGHRLAEPGIKSMRANVDAFLALPLARWRRKRKILSRQRGEDMGMTDDLLRWRAEFPIVETCTYLVSHSLGAMPRKTAVYLQEFADTWSTRGVRAWHEGWWEVGRETGNLLAPILGVAPQHDLDAPERHGRAGDHRVVLHLRRAAAQDRDERARVPVEPLPVRGLPPLRRRDRLRAVRRSDPARPAAVPRRDRRADRCWCRCRWSCSRAPSSPTRAR